MRKAKGFLPSSPLGPEVSKVGARGSSVHLSTSIPRARFGGVMASLRAGKVLGTQRWWGEGPPGDNGSGRIPAGGMVIVRLLLTERSLLSRSNMIFRSYYLLRKLPLQSVIKGALFAKTQLFFTASSAFQFC